MMAQPPSRSKTAPKLETKTKHRLSTSVSDVPYSPEDLTSGDGSKSGSFSSSLKDKIFKRRARSSLGGTEDLVKELDSLAPDPDGSSNGTPADGRPDDSQPSEYPALRAHPTEPDEDVETSDSSGDKEAVASRQNSSKDSKEAVRQNSSVRQAGNHPDVVELETKPGSAVELKAGAYSTNEEKDLWICRQCGWTYPNAHPSAKQRRNHKKVCQKHYTGVEVPPGSSDEASSGDEVHSEEQISAAKTQGLVKTEVKDESTDQADAIPRSFIKPTISTGSDSAKSSPVSSPGMGDSPFSSPAKRDPRLPTPTKKETPWGSPIKRSTPANSPSTSKKAASPVTSPVNRIMSTPVKRDSPPRPEKQEALTRAYTSKQQQEEEERKISVKNRIQELERITSSKAQSPTWSGKSGQLSSTGSPMRHGDDDRRKSMDVSPSGKLLKPLAPGGRKSLDSSPSSVTSKSSRHVQSSRKSGELTGTELLFTQSPGERKAAASSHVGKAPEPSVSQPSLQAEAANTPPGVPPTPEAVKVVAPPIETNNLKEPEKEVQETAVQPVSAVATSDVKAPSVNSVVTPVVAEVKAADATPVPSAGKTQAEGNAILTSQKPEEASERILPAVVGEVAKSGPEAAAHSRSSSLVLGEGGVAVPTAVSVPSQSGSVTPSPETMKHLAAQIVDAKDAQPKVAVPGDSIVEEPSAADIVLPDASPTKEAKETTSSSNEPAPVVDSSPQVNESSSAVGASVTKEELVQPNASSTERATSDPTVSKVESKAELPATITVVAAESEKVPSSKVSTESVSVRVPGSENPVGDVSPSTRPMDHDDDNSVLLKKQPAVDPLFVESQQDRMWEMHSQELSRRDGEASGADVRESSAQDDDPAQYANTSPLTPDVTSSGAKSNGNGTNEKNGKVDRPRTPLRSLIAEDDAADKGDESAPTGKETPIVSPRGNLFKRIVSGGKASPTKPSTPVAYEKKPSRPFLSSCICCSPVK